VVVAKNYLFILLVLCSIYLQANENNVIETVIKPNITKYFSNEKIEFLFVGKIDTDRFLAIIRYRELQDRITINTNGKILEISEDLNYMEEVEEGC